MGGTWWGDMDNWTAKSMPGFCKTFDEGNFYYHGVKMARENMPRTQQCSGMNQLSHRKQRAYPSMQKNWPLLCLVYFDVRGLSSVTHIIFLHVKTLLLFSKTWKIVKCTLFLGPGSENVQSFHRQAHNPVTLEETIWKGSEWIAVRKQRPINISTFSTMSLN